MKIATLGILLRDNRILLGRKRGRPEIGEGLLNGPGGKFEIGRDTSLIDCLIREAQEELGITLHHSFLEKGARIVFHAWGKPDFEVHVFRTTRFTGEPIPTESMLPEWHPVDRLPLEEMHESDRMWFPRLVRGERFCANVYYREHAKGFERIEFFPFA